MAKSGSVHLNEFSSFISLTIQKILTKSESTHHGLQKGVSNWPYGIPFSHKFLIILDAHKKYKIAIDRKWPQHLLTDMI